jgi:hypothetical protein
MYDRETFGRFSRMLRDDSLDFRRTSKECDGFLSLRGVAFLETAVFLNCRCTDCQLVFMLCWDSTHCGVNGKPTWYALSRDSEVPEQVGEDEIAVPDTVMDCGVAKRLHEMGVVGKT